MAKPNFDDLKLQLQSASVVAILLPKNPGFDAVAAALSLKLGLEQIHKSAQVSCSDPMTVEFHRLVGADSVTNNFGSRNLVISFPGQTEAVDKVSYNIENAILQLVVTPKAGTAGLDYHKLQFVSGGAQADLVIMVGVKDPADLGQIYLDAKDILPKINQYRLDGPSLSEVTTQILTSLNVPISSDISTNLLLGLELSTDHYQASFVSADTFEAAAILLRSGAKRADVAAPSNFPTGSIPVSQPTNPEPTNQLTSSPTDDWYEPKIYRGTTTA